VFFTVFAEFKETWNERDRQVIDTVKAEVFEHMQSSAFACA
jgi:hypothetical protein